MGGSKKPERPAVPEFQEDPRIDKGIDQLFNYGTDAANLNFKGPLAETIQTSPEMTTLYLQGLRAELEPIFRDERQNSINKMAAQGQLSGSTLPSELGRIESDLQNKYITQTSNFGMADINRAMQNRVSLYGTGLNTINRATGLAGNQQDATNKFALQKFENELALNELARKDGSGGWGGALQGALGGAAAGSSGGIGGMVLGGVIGGASGYFGPPGTGTGITQGGLGMGLTNSFGGFTNPIAKKEPGKINQTYFDSLNRSQFGF